MCVCLYYVDLRTKSEREDGAIHHNDKVALHPSIHISILGKPQINMQLLTDCMGCEEENTAAERNKGRSSLLLPKLPMLPGLFE